MDNPRLDYGATCFPILPVVNGYTVSGETVQVIALDERYDNSPYNLPRLREEVAQLEADKQITAEIKEISVPFDDSMQSHLTVFQRLIENIEDGDDLHACITFGSKPSPVIILLALNYAAKIKNHTRVSCIVYGQMNHHTHEGKIYDITAFMRMDELLDTLAKAKVRNVEELLRKILDV
ncbi:MAG: hypothetical protein II713_04625 [Clostridia bacterium]|nr:hypothetical protein [Clostridia bacterium]